MNGQTHRKRQIAEPPFDRDRIRLHGTFPCNASVILVKEKRCRFSVLYRIFQRRDKVGRPDPAPNIDFPDAVKFYNIIAAAASLHKLPVLAPGIGNQCLPLQLMCDIIPVLLPDLLPQFIIRIGPNILLPFREKGKKLILASILHGVHAKGIPQFSNKVIPEGDVISCFNTVDIGIQFDLRLSFPQDQHAHTPVDVCNCGLNLIDIEVHKCLCITHNLLLKVISADHADTDIKGRKRHENRHQPP